MHMGRKNGNSCGHDPEIELKSARMWTWRAIYVYTGILALAAFIKSKTSTFLFEDLQARGKQNRGTNKYI